MQYVTTCKIWTFAAFIWTLLYVFHLFFDVFLLISFHGKPVWTLVYVIIYYVGAGVTTLMAISDGLDPYLFRRKMKNTRSLKEELDGEVFISRQGRHFSL